MKVVLPLVAVCALFALGYLGGSVAPGWLVGAAVPYAAATVFLVGISYRVLLWARVPVPFRIPTTCGQQRSLPWIRPARLDNPFTGAGAIGRVLLEVLCFRSLLRNTRARFTPDRRLVYGTSLVLWLGALAMHWSLLIILLRHLRFAFDPVPGAIATLQGIDGFLEVGLPPWYVSTVLFVAATTYLLFRRLVRAQVRYISLPADYFPLLLLLGIGLSGLTLRHLLHTDVAAIKELTAGLVSFQPTVPAGISPLFFGHLFLVSVLLAYFPFSKLVHLGGIFLSPTRALANNSRAVRHINEWNYPVTVHAYADYEDELRAKMVGAGIPVERDA